MCGGPGGFKEAGVAQRVALRGCHMPEQLTSMQTTQGSTTAWEGPEECPVSHEAPLGEPSVGLHPCTSRPSGCPACRRRPGSSASGERGRCHRVRPVLSSESFLKASELKFKKAICWHYPQPLSSICFRECKTEKWVLNFFTKSLQHYDAKPYAACLLDTSKRDEFLNLQHGHWTNSEHIKPSTTLPTVKSPF